MGGQEIFYLCIPSRPTLVPPTSLYSMGTRAELAKTWSWHLSFVLHKGVRMYRSMRWPSMYLHHVVLHKTRGTSPYYKKCVCTSLILYGSYHHRIRLRILTLRVFISVWGQIYVCIFLLKHWNLHLYNQGHINTAPYIILHFTMNSYLIFFHTALILFLITDEWISEFIDPCNRFIITERCICLSSVVLAS